MELALNSLCPASYNGFPEILNRDLAIRRFCPERVMEKEQQQCHGSFSTSSTIYSWDDEAEAFLEDDNMIHSPSASQVDQFVDSFLVSDWDNHDGIGIDDHFTEVVPVEPNECHRLEEGEIVSLEVGEYDNGRGDAMVDVDMDIPTFMIGGEEPDHHMIMAGGSDDQEDQRLLVQDISGASPVGPLERKAGSRAVDQGMHLVHLLLACAEAVGCHDTQLAETMLAKIWTCVNPFGDSLQRVSYCFAIGLKSRLSILHSSGSNYGSFNGTPQLVSNVRGALADDGDSIMLSRDEKMEAVQFLHQATPYFAFGFLSANEAICQASGGHDRMHIVDLGMDHTLQWAPLFRALASRPEGPPTSIRITGITYCWCNYRDDHHRSHLETDLKALVNEANSMGIHMEFQVITDPPSPSLFSRERLDLWEGEALFVNSIMKLHEYVKESRGSLKAILQAIRRLGPTLLTVIEQDANHNGPFFLGRFLESLHYYSAIFDSLEASLPRGSPQRMRIEQVHYAEKIHNIVACEGAERVERHERADQWRRQLGRAGFQAVGLKCMSRARMMVSVYGCDGYSLGCEKGCLLLGWKGRPIMLASAWQVPASNYNHNHS